MNLDVSSTTNPGNSTTLSVPFREKVSEMFILLIVIGECEFVHL